MRRAARRDDKQAFGEADRRTMSSTSCPVREGLQLNRAFVKIKDAKVRRKIVEMVRRWPTRPTERTGLRTCRARAHCHALDLTRPVCKRRARLSAGVTACSVLLRFWREHGAQELSLHQRIGFRRASGQGVRPDLRRDRRPGLSRGAQDRNRPVEGPRRLRNAGDDQPGRHRRRGPRARLAVEEGQGRQHRQGCERQSGDQPGDSAPRRARRSARSATSRTASTGRTAKIDVLLHSQSADIAQGVDSAADAAGRGRRRRPGHHVRLCLQRDARPDAGADLLRPQILEAARRRPHIGEGEAAKLGPDAKSQVTVRYDDGKPAEVDLDRPFHPASRRRAGTPRRFARSSSPISAKRWAACRLPTTATGTSTRPANSSSAAPTAMPA